jgi:hypothetical protein
MLMRNEVVYTTLTIITQRLMQKVCYPKFSSNINNKKKRTKKDRTIKKKKSLKIE